MSGPWISGAIALCSIVAAEVVRDGYHWLGHTCQPFRSWHYVHHKVFRADLTPVNEDIYRWAEWVNDVPEALAMIVLTGLGGAVLWGQWHIPTGFVGSLYAGFFLLAAIARGLGYGKFTDFSHRPGPLTTPPIHWWVNRTYHWRHHFDRGEAYYSGTFTLVDKILGTSLSLKNKTVAVTGASGTLGRALLRELQRRGARPVALTHSPQSDFAEIAPDLPVHRWQMGQEESLRSLFETTDILILNHGINVMGRRDPAAIQLSFEVNAWSHLRLLDLFLATVQTSRDRACKEVWFNTSEAEVSPAFSPLYELSKRAVGQLVTLRRLDAPCTIRKLILGPFRSSLNPYGVMSGDWVAQAVLFWAVRGFRDIIVTVNPLTYLLFPLSETLRALYFRWFSHREKAC
ncbi:MAG: bifunctional sterol desaturase/short chain dehydrogenase [Pseudanabaenaceae cyanobacterium]